jgi:hypothetical protein
MPRQLRIEYPGVIYHLMNRGRAFSAGRDAPALRAGLKNQNEAMFMRVGGA